MFSMCTILLCQFYSWEPYNWWHAKIRCSITGWQTLQARHEDSSHKIWLLIFFHICMYQIWLLSPRLWISSMSFSRNLKIAHRLLLVKIFHFWRVYLVGWPNRFVKILKVILARRFLWSMFLILSKSLACNSSTVTALLK